MNISPNAQNSSRWRVSFSNIPTIEKSRDLDLYDLSVRSCIIPDINLRDHNIDFKASTRRVAMSRKNDEMTPLQIEFRVGENADNYLYLFEWALDLKYGTKNTTYDNVIKRTDIWILDNQRREKAKIYFTNCIPLNISSLSLTQGTSDELAFTFTLSYEEMLYERIT